jgi:hypothetical protein
VKAQFPPKLIIIKVKGETEGSRKMEPVVVVGVGERIEEIHHH